jgi:hypothetical protein
MISNREILGLSSRLAPFKIFPLFCFMVHTGLANANFCGVAFCISKVPWAFGCKSTPFTVRSYSPSPHSDLSQIEYSYNLLRKEVSGLRKQMTFFDLINKRSHLSLTMKGARNNGQPISFQTKTAAELLQLLRLQRTADPKSTALQRIAGYVAPPAQVEGFQINWVGNIDSHQRKLFWGLIEMLCEKLTIPFIIMMGVHNAIMTAHLSYKASCRALISAAGTAISTASVTASILVQQFNVIAGGWNRAMPSATSALSQAVSTCTDVARSAGPAAVGSVRLVSSAGRILVGASSTAAAVADVGLNIVHEAVRKFQSSTAAAATAAASAVATATPRSRAQRKRPKLSSGRDQTASSGSATAAADELNAGDVNFAPPEEAALTTRLSAAIRAERRRRMRGAGRVRVRKVGASGPGLGDGSEGGMWGVDTVRRVVDTVTSTKVIIAL